MQCTGDVCSVFPVTVNAAVSPRPSPVSPRNYSWQLWISAFLSVEREKESKSKSKL